jgi:hypothetical protein
MTDIFLSRPNWVPPEYENGLENFLTLFPSSAWECLSEAPASHYKLKLSPSLPRQIPEL